LTVTAAEDDAAVATKSARRRLGAFDSVVLSGAAINLVVAAVLFLYWLTH
jgi:hypothetical protein